MRRIALGSVITAAVLLAAVLAVALSRGSAPRPAGPLLVRGRVTAADGRPVAGIKVWLNAQPTASVVRALTAARQPVYVTVVTSATTSATGSYVIRVTSLAPLARDATHGTITFMLMTGNAAGWDARRFSRPVGSGGAQTADLRLMPDRSRAS
jgi:hypothetical protein